MKKRMTKYEKEQREIEERIIKDRLKLRDLNQNLNKQWLQKPKGV